MKEIDTIKTTLRDIMSTPQGEYYAYYFGEFPPKRTPPTAIEKAYYLRILNTATGTLERSRQAFREYCTPLFTNGAPPTPEIRHILSLLVRIGRACHNAGNEWPDDIDESKRRQVVAEWSAIGGYFDGWVGMIHEYFPQLDNDQVDNAGKLATDQDATVVSSGNPEFVRRLFNSDAYNNAVQDGKITRPAIWNGTIRGLAVWLEESGLLSTPQPFNVTEKTTKWARANGVFTIKGSPVSSTQLRNGFKH